MPLKLCQKLKNHFLISFVPFGGNFKDVIKPFINNILLLQKRLYIKINNWIIGELEVIIADHLQKNNFTDVLRHNANFGCRTCKVSKEELTLLDHDILLYGHYHHITDIKFLEIQQSETQNAKIILARSYGLCLKKIFLMNYFKIVIHKYHKILFI